MPGMNGIDFATSVLGVKPRCAGRDRVRLHGSRRTRSVRWPPACTSASASPTPSTRCATWSPRSCLNLSLAHRRVGDPDVPRLRSHAPDPRQHVRVGGKVDARHPAPRACRRTARCPRSYSARSRRSCGARGAVPSPPALRDPSRGAPAAPRGGANPAGRWRTMDRGVATYGSWLYCSKNIHCSACARPSRSCRHEGRVLRRGTTGWRWTRRGTCRRPAPASGCARSGSSPGTPACGWHR